MLRVSLLGGILLPSKIIALYGDKQMANHVMEEEYLPVFSECDRIPWDVLVCRKKENEKCLFV